MLLLGVVVVVVVGCCWVFGFFCVCVLLLN